MVPRIVHFIFLPWDTNHRLKDDEHDFDHSPVETMRRYAPDFDVRLWTRTAVFEFCRSTYPDVWETLRRCPHPTMMVDILRWLVVYHFGGVYWQMSATPLVPMDSFLPSAGKNVRLFTEFMLAPEKCRAMAAEPIRNGEPEEPIRVLNQVFAARPKADFVRRFLDFILDRNRRLAPKNDYDILYIGANAALSTAYDQFGKNDDSVERMDLSQSRRMLKWRYLGTWRKSAEPCAAAQAPGSGQPRLDAFPALASAAYRWLFRHPHAAMLAAQDAARPRASLLPALAPAIERLGIRSVCEAPSGLVGNCAFPIEYVGCDPCRSVVSSNRMAARSSGFRFRCANMLYSRFPTVDLFLCPDFLEWIPFSEAQRVLRRIAASRPRYLALTGYRLLDEAWDAALGDFHPFSFRAPPFDFPKPIKTISLPPLAGRRPDRYLLVFPNVSRL